MNNLNFKNDLAFARSFAIEKHANQMYANYPYVYHLDKVHEIVKELNLGYEYEIAAYLHDLIEDTDVTKEDIERLFNKRIANIVDAVSGFGENRTDCQKEIVRKLSLCPDAIDLKMADRLANIRSSKINKKSLFEKYKKEHSLFFVVFSKGSKILMEEIEKNLEIIPARSLIHKLIKA